jgi:spore maturation protein SpmA/spore maturation protein SpmB
MINIIWGGLFLSAIFVALWNGIVLHDTETFNSIVAAIFSSTQTAVEISISLVGILSFWLGILKLIEEAGLAKKISHFLSPLFRVIMKDIPKDSQAISTVVLNLAANFLGLDNAATPLGIKAMQQLQEYNKTKDEASDAEILFMILNASSVTFIPITIFMYRSQLGASRPTDVFIPILLATSVSSLVGFLCVAIRQKINLFNKIVLLWLGSFLGIFLLLLTGFYMLSPSDRLSISTVFGNILLVCIIGGVLLISLKNKILCYEVFVEGAKEGFSTALQILPYLLTMLVAIGVFRASGILDYFIDVIKQACSLLNINSDFADALPTAFIKPFSGSGARAMMVETMQTYGANSFPAFCSSVIQGSTETTFYVLTVYFGAINISRVRYALAYSLIADFAGIVSAIIFSYMFYTN